MIVDIQMMILRSIGSNIAYACHKIESGLANYFDLKVVSFKAYNDPDAMASASITNTENTTSKLKFKLYSDTLDGKRLEAGESPKIIISTAHVVERVVRLIFQIFTIAASVGIGVLGFMGVINPLSSTFVIIGLVSTIVSIVLFVMSRYFDYRFKKQMKEDGLQPVVRPTNEVWTQLRLCGFSMDGGLSKDDIAALNQDNLNDDLYIPKIDIDNFLAEIPPPKALLLEALHSIKKTVYHACGSSEKDEIKV